MKFKKILSGVLASSMLVSAMPVFSASAADTDVTGNSILDAVDITLGEIISSDLQSNDNDWYKITLPSSGKVTITLAAESCASACFKLVNGDDEATVLSQKDFNDTNIFTYYLTAGDYYIYLSMGYNVRSYDIQVKFTSSDVTVENEDNNTIAKASAVDYDGTVYKRQLSLNDSVDYYTFNLAEKGRVTLNFDSSMKNVDWEIYDSEDSNIKEGTFTKKTDDSGISAKESNILKEGKYTIAIKKKDSYGDYSFSLDYIQNYNDLSVSGIIAAGDIDGDGKIDASDASFILMYYAYLSTGGTETDMNKWLANNK